MTRKQMQRLKVVKAARTDPYSGMPSEVGALELVTGDDENNIGVVGMATLSVAMLGIGVGVSVLFGINGRRRMETRDVSTQSQTTYTAVRETTRGQARFRPLGERHHGAWPCSGTAWAATGSERGG